MSLNELFLLSLCTGIVGGVAEFIPYVRVMDRSIYGFPTTPYKASLFAECLQQCRALSNCESATFRQSNSSCLIHSIHPVQDSVKTMVSVGSELYYSLECPTNWYKLGNKCYKYKLLTATWSEARDHCTAIGGNLVKIESAEEQEFIVTHINPAYTPFWIGAYWDAGFGEFLWSDGTRLEFEAWGGVNPDVNGGCVDLIQTESYNWNDHSNCNENIYFICEKI